MNNESHDSGTSALDEDLARVLREAPLPAGTDGWADLVMTRSRRRTRMSVLAAGTAAGLVAVGVAFASHQTTTTAVPATTQSSTADVSASPTTSTPSTAATPSPTPPSSSRPSPSEPPVTVVHLKIGSTMDLPNGARLVVRATSLCLALRGESISAKDLNCGYIRNGNTGPGTFTSEEYGDHHMVIDWGVGDAFASRVSDQLPDGTYLPVTLIRPIGDTWTGYVALGPGIGHVEIGPSSNPMRFDRSITAYDASGHPISQLPPDGASASPTR